MTQLTARDAGDFLVDRNVPADVERIRFVAFIEKLELRIEEDKLGLIAIEIDAAEENDFAAGAEFAGGEIAAVEPFRMGEAAAVGEDHVEDAASRARLDHAAAIDAGMNRGILADSQRRERDKVRAILVRLRDVKQEILNRPDASRCEQRGAARPHASHILDVRVKA